MRSGHLSVCCSMAVGICSLTAAAGGGPDIVAEGGPLLRELSKAKYEASRCMLAPVLAADGRVVIKGPDPTFTPGEAFVAIDGDVLDAHSRTAVIDILERRPPAGRVTVRVSRRGVERVVTAQCTDSKPYYAELREAARAAVAGDAELCARRSQSAARLHGLSSVWLRLSMSCQIAAGRLVGASMWRADYELFSQRIAEAQSDPALLKSLRHPVVSAARDLSDHGYRGLGDRLRRDYGAALATLGAPVDDD